MWSVVAFYLAASCINSFAASVCARRGRRLLSKPFSPLPDIGHDFLPRIPHYSPDAILWLEVALTLVFGTEYVTSDQWITAAVSHGLLVLLRGITVALTTYPTCMPDTESPTWHKNSAFRRIYDSCFHTTHDLMFSGHTQVYLVFAYIWEAFILDERPSIFLICWVVRLCAATGLVSLVASRQHYSSDVVVSCLISVFLLHSTIPQQLTDILLQL